MKMLFSAYRLDQFADPDGFMAQAAIVFSQYPLDVIEYVTDPLTGIQSKNKWPPNIPEIHEACKRARDFLRAEKTLREGGWNWTGEKWEKVA